MNRIPPRWKFAFLILLAFEAWSFPGPKHRNPLEHYDEDQLSKAEFKVRMEHNLRVPMRDGVELSADVYRPDAPGRLPVLLVRTPYSNNGKDAIRDDIYQSLFYAERGYAVVQQDVRGRYDSDGGFYPFRNEAADGYDTGEWVQKQEWSNGRIGAMGQSYFGLTQLLQAATGDRHLSAIVPNATTLDLFGSWFYTGGAFNYGFALSWAVTLDGRTNQEHAAYDWPKVVRHLPVGTSDEAAGRRIRFYREWARHSSYDDYWGQNDLRSERERIAVPSLSISGWYDVFLKGLLDDWAAMKTGPGSAGKPHYLMIGPWEHTLGENPAGKFDFGPEAELDLSLVQLRWYDRWLKSIENGVDREPPIKIFTMGENRWRYENEWPLARTRYTNYYFSSGGKANSLKGNGVLTPEIPRPGAASDSFVYNPDDPVPTLGGCNCCDNEVAPMGAFDQRKAEQRSDVLVYSTAKLGKPLEVTGPLKVILYASTTAKDTDFTAKLVDVHPGGRLQNLQDGIIRARYRSSGEKPSFITPGQVHEYVIDLWATSNTFLPGHRIRVEISSSNFPRFDRNLNTGGDPATETAMAKAAQTIYHSAQYPSRIVLPVIPGR